MKLIHVSDLHIGRPFPHADPSVIDRIPGFRGHDPVALDVLGDFLDRQTALDPASRIVVTGDLTAYATEQQFDLARDFLAGRTLLQGRADGALVAGGPGHGVVPGNHDYWLGAPVYRDTLARGFHRTFDRLPAVSDPIPLDNGWALRILRIDSSEDSHRELVLARGKCTRQIHELNRMLNHTARGRRELRVLLMHHPPLYRRSSRTSWKPRLELDPHSTQDLLRVIRRHGVDAVLAGHLHTPSATTSSAFGYPFTEVVCGTSARRTEPDGHDGPTREGGANTVYVHTISTHSDNDDATLSWSSQLYVEEIGYFSPYGPPHSFSRHEA